MNNAIERQVLELLDAMHSDDPSNIWSNTGDRRLDSVLSSLADAYVEDEPEGSREAIRKELQQIRDTWSLVIFVRRAGLLVATEGDANWLRRGLVVASMIDARCDYRDLIVSLVLLRVGARRAGLESYDAFNSAISWSSERMREILMNARDHPESAIQLTIEAFGPPQWP